MKKIFFFLLLCNHVAMFYGSYYERELADRLYGLYISGEYNFNVFYLYKLIKFKYSYDASKGVRVNFDKTRKYILEALSEGNDYAIDFAEENLDFVIPNKVTRKLLG